MGEHIIRYLAGLSRRERWLLVLLIVVALPMAAVFGLILPLNQARKAAQAEVHETRAVEKWVAARAADYLAQGAELRATGAAAPASRTPIGISGIELSLVEAGLRKDVTELANNADGGVTLRFDEVAFTGLTNWLSLNEMSWGYKLDAFNFGRGTRNDLVEAEFKLVPAR